jgi:uncharacterized membrane protein
MSNRDSDQKSNLVNRQEENGRRKNMGNERETNGKFTVKDMVVVALMAALIFVVTFLVRIPVPLTSGGYINIGDVMILISAWLIGGTRADLRTAMAVFAAAAIGSALSDLSAGAAIYIFPTFFIKGTMGFVARLIIAPRRRLPAYVMAAVTAGAIMIAGYFLFEYFFFSPAYALAALPFNGVQWGGSVAIATVLFPVVRQVEARI